MLIVELKRLAYMSHASVIKKLHKPTCSHQYKDGLVKWCIIDHHELILYFNLVLGINELKIKKPRLQLENGFVLFSLT